MVRSGAEPGAGEEAWTYATVTQEGETTSAGRFMPGVASHAGAPFGGVHGVDD